MQLHFTGRNLEVTPALKAFITEKFERVQRRDNHINNVNVVLHIEHLTHTAEATFHASGADFHATAEADDMYKAIDELVDKLVAQLTKHKEKH